jgi:hypothetical protein
VNGPCKVLAHAGTSAVLDPAIALYAHGVNGSHPVSNDPTDCSYTDGKSVGQSAWMLELQYLPVVPGGASAATIYKTTATAFTSGTHDQNTSIAKLRNFGADEAIEDVHTNATGNPPLVTVTIVWLKGSKVGVITVWNPVAKAGEWDTGSSSSGHLLQKIMQRL